MKNYLQIAGRAMRYQNRLLYIPSLDKLVFCYQQNLKMLTLGGPSNFLTDAKSTIIRQKIGAADFRKYNPIIVDEDKLSTYKFLHQHKWEYRKGWVWATQSSKIDDDKLFIKFNEAEFIDDGER